MLGCIGCDQATKAAAQHYLETAGTLSYLGDFFRLQYAENTGAMLSLGGDLSETWRFVIFTLGTGAMLLGLFVYVLV